MSVFCMGKCKGVYVSRSSYRDCEEFLTGSIQKTVRMYTNYAL